eukprot:1974896-Prymnesium_polylepis.1
MDAFRPLSQQAQAAVQGTHSPRCYRLAADTTRGGGRGQGERAGDSRHAADGANALQYGAGGTSGRSAEVDQRKAPPASGGAAQKLFQRHAVHRRQRADREFG